MLSFLSFSDRTMQTMQRHASRHLGTESSTGWPSMSPTPSRSKAMMWDSKPLGAAPLSFGCSAGQGTQQLSRILLPIMFFYRMPLSLTFTGESIRYQYLRNHNSFACNFRCRLAFNVLSVLFKFTCTLNKNIGVDMQQKQQGSLGIAFDVMWYEPMTNSSEDIDATQRAQDFQFGWWGRAFN